MNPEENSRVGLRELLLRLLTRLRRLLGVAAQAIAQRDQLQALNEETRRLGTASVESATYVAAELRAIAERLSRLEQEMAELHRLLERQQRSPSPESKEREDEVVARPPSG
jgi:hypothetical protein